MAAGFARRNRVARALAFVVALLVLFVSLSAEAKKKKPAKKHKTPATKSKGKAALPDSAPESDEASSDEKSPSSGADDEEDKPKAAPPPSPVGEEEAAAKKPAKAKPASESAEAEGAGGGPIALKIGVGGRALFRQLRWSDDGGQLAPYTLSPGPEASVWFEAYPAAFATDGFAANIGLFGRFDYGFGASSKTPAGQTLTTKYQDFLVGLKIRIPLGMVLPYVAGAYGMQKFALEPFDPAGTRPNFNYGFVNAGGGALFQVTPELDIDVGAGFLYVMNPGSSAGEIKSPQLYPRAAANGVDVTLSAGYRVLSMIGVRLGVDFRQFGVATGWRTGDTVTRAGGATDRNITVWGGVELVFDGLGGGAGDSEPAPAKKPAAKPKKPAGEGEEGDATEPAEGSEN